VTEFVRWKVRLFGSGALVREPVPLIPPVFGVLTVTGFKSAFANGFSGYHLRSRQIPNSARPMLQPPVELIEACQGGVIAIGNFDGVHRGHQRMVEVLCDQSRLAKAPAVVMTFDPPPAAILRPGAVPPSLTIPAQRADMLKGYGVGQVVIWPTEQALLNLTAREFFQQILVDSFQAVGIVEGPNFRFGKGRKGDIEMLRGLCDDAGINLEVVVPVESDTGMVSSSRIRELVSSGRISDAVDLLGHPYEVCGQVVQGAGRGRTLGFPTANLSEIPTLLPGDGVYAGFCELEGRQYDCAVNVGRNPTFNEGRTKVEVHVMKWAADLYGKQLAVSLIADIREVRQFESASDLGRQIEQDIDSVRTLCARYRAE